MRKCIGTIRLEGKRLDYYVFGSRSTGFGIEITETCVEKAEQVISQSLSQTLSLARKLRCGSVFPENLSEIAEDFTLARNSD